MSLKNSMILVHKALEASGVPHALIGGIALSVWGYPRATNDIDFLVHGEFKAESERQMLSHGFALAFSSNEVAQWDGDHPVDFLYANREISKSMLARAMIAPQIDIPVLDPTDIIGLKIQAYKNNPKRELQDLADIQKMIEVNQIDWKRVQHYAEAFGEWDRIKGFKNS